MSAPFLELEIWFESGRNSLNSFFANKSRYKFRTISDFFNVYFSFSGSKDTPEVKSEIDSYEVRGALHLCPCSLLVTTEPPL